MPISEFILGLVRALAWPLTVFLIALIFRHEMRGILKRLSRVKYGDWEAHFEKDLERAERNASLIQIPDNRTLEVTEPTEYERMIRLTEISPCAALMEAWKGIELAVSRVIQTEGIDVKHKIIGTPEVHELVRRGLLPKDMLLVYSDLKQLRNRTAHRAADEMDQTAARRYIELASIFIAKLNEISNMSMPSP
ncbi:MAG: hypothetical protein NT006_06325 [Candidatus Aminicenantes bacterium]|nr:hypothetical protein [Candidatus Aminicenantes bacterium]